MSLEEMILRDELRREPATPGEIRRLVDAAERRIEDASTHRSIQRRGLSRRTTRS